MSTTFNRVEDQVTNFHRIIGFLALVVADIPAVASIVRALWKSSEANSGEQPCEHWCCRPAANLSDALAICRF